MLKKIIKPALIENTIFSIEGITKLVKYNNYRILTLIFKKKGNIACGKSTVLGLNQK